MLCFRKIILIAGIFGALTCEMTQCKGTATSLGKETAEATYHQLPSFYDKLPQTPKGGTFYDLLRGDPKTINPILNTEAFSSQVSGALFMSLMNLDPENLNFLPALATSYKISADKLSYTFFLNPEATWDDGSQVTSEDVEFTLNTILNPATHAAMQRSYWEGISIKVHDKTTFTFKVPEVKFNTLINLSGFQPVQKKQFANTKNFNEDPGILNPVGNAAYKLTKYMRSQQIEFTRKKNWWGYNYKHFAQTYNFDSIILKIIPDINLSYERFIRGEIHSLQFTSEIWSTKVTNIDRDKYAFSLKKTEKKLRALQLTNDTPKPYMYIGLNLKNPIFKDVNTRKALAHLIDYEKMSEKVFFNLWTQCFSPFGSQSLNSAPELRDKHNRIQFDRAKAIQILKQSGWQLNKQNLLSKMIDGKMNNFEFTLEVPSIAPALLKISQIFQEDLKKTGIKMNIKAVEWNSLLSSLEEKKFEAVIIGWRSSLFPDPKQIFHSSSAERGGSNYISYANPKVDSLILNANRELDIQKRALIMQEINRILYADQVYLFLFEQKFALEGLNAKIKTHYPIAKYENGTGSDRYYFSR
ncbi:MAG: hypothetical protein K2X39_05965 [Silvanigrellaceae bacterium]|nr:hypothetical protein [Silvanigrellaceae bacterium]